MMKGWLLAFTGMAKGLSGWQPACPLFVVIPAEAGIQEGRWRGACTHAGFPRFAPNVLSCHSRYAGMYSLNHWIPAFAGMTAGWLPAYTEMTKEVAVGHLSGMAKGLSGWQPTCPPFVVIPAQAGIQEGRCRDAGTHAGFSRFAPNILSCHSRYAGMDCLNHWIPAFAGMTVSFGFRPPPE